VQIDSTDRKNFIGILFGDLLGQGINFFVNLFIAIHFGAVVFGIISNGNAIASCVAVIVACGIPSILSRNIVQNRGDPAQLISTAIFLRLMIGAIVNLVIMAGLIYSDYSNTEKTSVVILSLAATMGLFNLDQSFDALKRSFAHSMLRLLFFNLTYLILIVAVFLLMPETSVIPVVICLLLAALIFSTSNLIYFHSRVQPLTLTFNQSLARDLMKEAMPIFLTSLLAVVYLNFAVLYLRHDNGLIAAADYSAASRLILILIMLDVAIMRVMVPKISALTFQPTQHHFTALLKIALLRLLYMIPLAGSLAFFAAPIVDLIYQGQYAESAPVLMLLAIWLIGTCLNHLGTYLYSHGAMTRYVRWNVMKVMLLLLMVFVIIKPEDPYQFALSLAVTEYTSALLVLIYVKLTIRDRLESAAA
jgi:lipopolysaccharide exporter